jgi:transposase-like protein
MRQQSKYSDDFKGAVITKLLNRGSQTFHEVCLQEGVSKSCGYSWINSRDIVGGMTKSKSNGWTAEAKLKALVESNNLNEEELGIFLRKEGLHSHQIKGWRTEVLGVLGPRTGKGLARDDRNQRIKELERDVNRKDKALAEVSALLILQKKVNLFWGNKSEDEK